MSEAAGEKKDRQLENVNPGGMCQSEVVFLVGSVVSPWYNVVDVKLTSVKYEVDYVVANEATTRLPVQQSLLKPTATFVVK